MLVTRSVTLLRCTRAGFTKVTPPLRSTFTTTSKQFNSQRSARFAANTGMGVKPTSLKEKLMAPAGPWAFGLGRGVVAGTAALGVGALCFYGSGVSGMGIREKSGMWPQYVRDRVQSTYLYFGGSLAVTAAAATAVFRTPALLRVVSYQGVMGMLVSLGALIGSSMLCQAIPYTSETTALKHMTWVLHSGVVGAVLAPLCMLGGPLLTRAAIYTAGVVGGLSSIAVCAPSEKFLNWGAPLGMGLGAVFMASLAGAFLPPTTALGAGLYSISVYGGLVVFSGLMLYDTQKVVKRAEITPYNSQPPFDPINACMSIYMDAVNIFIRIAFMLAGGGNKRK